MPEREPIDWEEALRLHRSGWTLAEIAREFGYAYKTVWTKRRPMGRLRAQRLRRRATEVGQKL